MTSQSDRLETFSGLWVASYQTCDHVLGVRAKQIRSENSAKDVILPNRLLASQLFPSDDVCGNVRFGRCKMRINYSH